MEMVLEWVKACPFKYRVSSYQGGAISVRVDVPEHEWSVDDGQHYETEQPNYTVVGTIKEERNDDSTDD
tara:strand:- start:3411 stop:3617 length:207 start_codon:yes stop_codon:yes gene_type:complete